MKRLQLNGKILHVEAGWQHSPRQTHYRVSPGQAKRHSLSEADIPVCSGIQLFVGPPADGCPHCTVRERGEPGYTIIAL